MNLLDKLYFSLCTYGKILFIGSKAAYTFFMLFMLPIFGLVLCLMTLICFLIHCVGSIFVLLILSGIVSFLISYKITGQYFYDYKTNRVTANDKSTSSWLIFAFLSTSIGVSLLGFVLTFLLYSRYLIN